MMAGRYQTTLQAVIVKTDEPMNPDDNDDKANAMGSDFGSNPTTKPGRKLAEGRQFYDDEYSDLDEDDDELPDKINFSDKLYGRTNELSRLLSIYIKMTTDSPRKSKTKNRALTYGGSSKMSDISPFVLITGPAGSGKSSLVHKFINQIKTKAQSCQLRPFLFTCGKFLNTSASENQKQVPFSAIVQAFSSLGMLLQQDKYHEDKRQIRDSINAVLGKELSTLSSIIPQFTAALEHDTASLSTKRSTRIDGSSPIVASENAWNQIQYLFKGLIRGICSDHRPLILFLDDMQWAGDASLNLLFSLAADKSIKNFFVLTSARPLGETEEECKNHPLTKRLEKLEAENFIKVERMNLRNLNEVEIKDFISDTFHLDRNEIEKIRTLATAVYSKTQGNIFFARQALEELFRKNVLYYDTISFEWTWDMKSAELLQQDISDNVLQAVTSKILATSIDLQRVLIVAAYTRSTIDVDTLMALIGCDGKGPFKSVEALTKVLDEGVLSGLLSNNIGSSDYKFAHDRIQEASYSLITGAKREQLRLGIGKKLYEIIGTENGEDWMLFVAADHLNCATTSFLDPAFLIKLNLECGETAITMAAFQQSRVYLSQAMVICNNLKNAWSKLYELTLRLHQVSANVEFVLGNLVDGNRLASEVLKKAKTLDDKLPVYLALTIAEGKAEHFSASMKVCRSALTQLGELPKRFELLHVITHLYSVKRYFRRNSDANFLDIPKMTDPRKLATMDLLGYGANFAYTSGNTLAYLLFVLRMLQVTFESGICGRSAAALSGYAIVISRGGDQQGALRIAALVDKILEITEAKMVTGISTFITILYVRAWSMPPEMAMDAIKHAGTVALECGDLYNGYINRYALHSLAFAYGYPLLDVYHFGCKLIDEMKVYREDTTLSTLTAQRLPTLYLLGKVIGSINWDALEERWTDSMAVASPFTMIQIALSILQIGFYFGNLDLAERMAHALGSYMSDDEAFLNLDFRIFFSGLTYSRLAKTQKCSPKEKAQYISHARKMKRRMKNIVNKKGDNPRHKYLLMRADLLATHGDMILTEELQETYDKAIEACLEIGFNHLAAVGSELAGETFLHRNHIELAKRYLAMARYHYGVWGARAKVSDLECCYGNLIGDISSEEVITWLPQSQLEESKDFRHDSDVLSVNTDMTTMKISFQSSSLEFNGSEVGSLEFEGET